MKIHWKYWLLWLWLPGCLPDEPPQIDAPAEVTMVETLGNSSFFASTPMPDGGFAFCGTIDTVAGGWDHDLFVVRTNAAGTVIRTATIEAGFEAYGSHMVQSPDGGIIIAVAPSRGNGIGDLMLLKLDEDLNRHWSTRETALSAELVLGMVPNSQGVLVAIRTFNGTLSLHSYTYDGQRFNTVNLPQIVPFSSRMCATEGPNGGMALIAFMNQVGNWTNTLIVFDSTGQMLQTEVLSFPQEINRMPVGLAHTQAGDYRVLASDPAGLSLYAMPADLSFFALVDTLATDLLSYTSLAMDANDHLHLTGSTRGEYSYGTDGQLDMKWVELDVNGEFVREFNVTGPGRTFLRSVTIGLDGLPVIAGQSNNYSEDKSTDALILRP